MEPKDQSQYLDLGAVPSEKQMARRADQLWRFTRGHAVADRCGFRKLFQRTCWACLISSVELPARSPTVTTHRNWPITDGLDATLCCHWARLSERPLSKAGTVS